MNDLLGQISGVPIQSELRVDALDLFDDGNSYLGPSSEIVQSSRSVYAQSASIDVSEISCTSTMSTLDKSQLAEYKKSYIEIIDQPQAKAVRFRYECEGRSAGSIPGCKTSAENKTYPTIKVVGKKGPATVVVSCVTVDPPYKPHPHSVVGREGHCKDGICRVDINEETMTCSFPYIGIQCKKKKDVADALRERERLKVDPFRTGFSHKDQPQNIDLNCVRLCFQVFYKLPGCFHELNPVVSNPIFDKKATTELVITKISHCSGSVCGGEDVILLCDKVPKDDIDIRFFEMDQSGKIVWEDKADFQPANVHKQYAIVFKTPRYKNIDIQNNVKVKMQLVKRSDKSTSAPVDYEYLASESGRTFRSFKRLKDNSGLFHRILGLDVPVSLPSEDLHHKKSTTVSTVPAVPSKAVPKEMPAPPSQPPTLSQPVPVYARSQSPIISSKPVSIQVRTMDPSNSDQSLDDIKNRLNASLDRRPGCVSPVFKQAALPVKQPQFWSDDASVYSENELLEVLSQGSVNDLLSAVGEGFTVYEDVNEPTPLPEDIPPDTMYGDASYASCYSNMEFVMDRAKAANVPFGSNANHPNKVLPPVLPPKKGAKDQFDLIDDEDMAIYGTPSGKPIHPDKMSLLKQRGFSHPETTGPDQNFYNLKGLEDLIDDASNENKGSLSPVLDLFV